MLVLLLGTPATATAAPATIAFDDLPDGTVVSDQYLLAALPGKGVRFGIKADGTAGEPIGAQADTRATSAPNLGYVPPGSGEFCPQKDNALWGKFEFARTEVSLKAWGRQTVTLRGYDAAGKLVVSSAAVSPPGLELVPLAITAPAGTSIVYFKIEPTHGCFAVNVDDIVFDDLAGAPLPPPDFGLASDAGSLGLLRDGSATVSVRVNRANGATGPLLFGINGPPPGVTATVVGPNPTAAGEVAIKLTATPQALIVDHTPVTVTATPQSPEAGIAARRLTFPLTVHDRYDMRIIGMEVSQGIQEQFEPCATTQQCLTLPSLPFPTDVKRTLPYEGVRLAAGKRTAVRVFANVKTGPAVRDVTVALTASRNGKPLPGGPLVSAAKALSPNTHPWVTWSERTSPNGAFNFILPAAWTVGTVNLRAEVVPPLGFIGTGDAECEPLSCRLNNVLQTDGVGFLSTGRVTLATARLWHTGENVSAFPLGSVLGPKYLPDPEVAFALTEQLLPLSEGGLDYDHTDYYSTIDVSDIVRDIPDAGGVSRGNDRRNKALDRLEDYADDNPGCSWARYCADSVMGVYGPQITTSGVSRNKVVAQFGGGSPTTAAGLRASDTGGAAYNGEEHIAVTSYAAPLTGIHEFTHGIGRVHADTVCGGDSNGQVGEQLTADGMGTLDGVGLRLSDFTPIAPTTLGSVSGSGNVHRDYMGYCDSSDWTTVIGWEKNFSLLRAIAKATKRLSAASSSTFAPQELGRSAAPTANLLRVHAVIDGPTTRMQSVKPRLGAPAAHPASSPLVLVARDAAGAERSRTPMAITKAVADDNGHLFYASVDIPAAGVQKLELLRDGNLAATRQASANRPRVRILAPRPGSTVGRTRDTLLRWRATDADNDALLIKVDYSINDGRSFEPIYLGPDNGSVRVPNGVFAGSRRARIRIRANDGFREVAVRSGRFRAVPRRPTVELQSPRPLARVRADETIAADVVAHDDRRALIRSARLVSWYDGRRLIARGAHTSFTGLRPGTRRLRVVVRDGRGAAAVRSVLVRVLAVRPQVLGLRAPRQISPRARALRLRIRTSVPATLRVAGTGRPVRAVAVSRSTRPVTVRVRPGRTPLRLRLLVRAGKQLRTFELSVRR